MPGTGAYTHSMASNYNMVGRPPVIAVANGAARLLVRRETSSDPASVRRYRPDEEWVRS